MVAEYGVNLGHYVFENALFNLFVSESHLVGQCVVQYYPSGCGLYLFAVYRDLYASAQFDGAEFMGKQRVFGVAENAPRAPRLLVHNRHVIGAEHNVQRRSYDRLARAWGQHIICAEHHLPGFQNRLARQRHVDGHLVAVEVGVERRAYEGVKLDSAAPSIRTGSNAWIPRRWSVGARLSSTRRSLTTSSSMSQTAGCMRSAIRFALFMLWA